MHFAAAPMQDAATRRRSVSTVLIDEERELNVPGAVA
jgi:hypothetical protein